MDEATILKLQIHKPLFFVPLGNKKWFTDLGIDNCIEADWDDEHLIKKNDSTSYTIGYLFPIWIISGCTPCQHFSGRSLTDRNMTLWSSWFLKTKHKRFFFGGDTGYRSVPKGTLNKDIDTLPRCPAFKVIWNLKCIYS